MSFQSKIDELARKINDLKNDELDDSFRGLFKCLEELKDLQTVKRKKPAKEVNKKEAKENSFKEFTKWLQSNGVKMDNIRFGLDLAEGNGIVSSKEIQKGDTLLQIPEKLMITNKTALNSELKDFITTDMLAQRNASVALALHLLYERNKLKSFWSPYLRILPESFSMPFHWSLAELEELKGTVAMTDIIRTFKNLIQQYIYLYNKFSKTQSTLFEASKFYFKDYMWAMSIVMSRQNEIPINKEATQLALIPVWDMCNHVEGNITTYYDLEKEICECIAMKPFKPNEQVYIYYGARPNWEFLLFQGFVFPGNQSDYIKLRVEGISSTDPLNKEKTDLLVKNNLQKPDTRVSKSTVKDELLAYCRVVALNATEIADEKAVSSIRNNPVNERNEEEAKQLCVKRLEEQLKAYNTSIEKDKELLQDQKMSYHLRCAVQLRLAEKEIIRDSVAALNQKKKKKKKANKENPKEEEASNKE